MSAPSAGIAGEPLFQEAPAQTRELRSRYRDLVDSRQRIFHGITALIEAGDVERLRRLRSEGPDENGTIEILDEVGRHCADQGLDDPFRPGESAAVHGLRALACLGLSLVQDQPSAGDLRAAVRWYQAAAVSVPTPEDGLRKLAGAWPGSRLGAALAELAAIGAEPGLGGPATVAAVNLVALSRPAVFRRRRLTPRPGIGVLFEGGGGGLRASLHARLVRELPGCLVPDPFSMTLFSGDAAFRASLEEAWRQARGAKIHGAVLWSLQDADKPLERVTDESLGGALTTVFNEVRRNRHRAVTIFRAKLRDKTAITGRVAGAELRSVGGYGDKFNAVEHYGRVILPADDVRKARDHAKEGTEIVPVRTWARAAWKARRADGRLWAIRAGAASVAVAVAVGVVSLILWDDLGEAETRRVAERVAAQARDFEGSDPSLAALLALAAYGLDDSAGTVAAMTRISQAATLIAKKIDAHPGGVTALTQAADSNVLYSAGRDGTVAAWDMRDGRSLARLRYSPAVIDRLAVHASVPLMLSADQRGGIQLWQTAGAGPLSGPDALAEPDAQQNIDDGSTSDNIVGLGFLGGARAYAITRDGTIRVWDTVVRRLLAETTLDEFADLSPATTAREIAAVAEAPDGVVPEEGGYPVTVITGSGEILDLDLERRRAHLVGQSSRLASGVTAIAARPDDDTQPGERVFAMGTAGGVLLWDAVSGTEIPSGLGVTAGVTGLSFGSGGDTLAVGTEGGVMMARAREDTPDHRFVAAGELQGGPVELLSSGSDPTGLVAAGHDSGLISILDGENRRIAAPPADASTVMAFDRDGRMLVTGELNQVRASRLRILKPAEGPEPVDESASSRAKPSYAEVLTLDADPMWWNQGARFFSNDAVLTRDFAVAAGQDPGGSGVVLVWDARSGEPLRELEFPGGTPDLVSGVRLVPEMSALVARSMSGVIRAWSTRTWELLFEMTVGRGGGIEVRPGTTTVVLPVQTKRSGSPLAERGSLAFVDLRKRKLHVKSVPGDVYRTSYTPDGDLLATLSMDNRLRFLDGDGEQRPDSPVIPFTSLPGDIAVGPSGERVAVSLADGQTVVYRIATGTLAMAPLKDADGFRNVNLAWDPHSDLLAVGSLNQETGSKAGGRVNLWHTRNATWAKQLCGLAGRDITEAEWKRYIPEFDHRPLCPSTS